MPILNHIFDIDIGLVWLSGHVNSEKILYKNPLERKETNKIKWTHFPFHSLPLRKRNSVLWFAREKMVTKTWRTKVGQLIFGVCVVFQANSSFHSVSVLIVDNEWLKIGKKWPNIIYNNQQRTVTKPKPAKQLIPKQLHTNLK